MWFAKGWEMETDMWCRDLYDVACLPPGLQPNACLAIDPTMLQPTECVSKQGIR